jgi:hypothetical protein
MMRAPIVLAFALAGAWPLTAQRPDSVTIVAGAEYGAGSLHKSLFGDNYRTQWTLPMRVEVLDLKRTAGGLTPGETGGGNQTRSIRFKGGDGQTYVFRSVNKWPLALPPVVRGSFLEPLFLDQISAHHPAAVLIASPLLKAAGVLSPTPRLRVMPDDAALGEHREQFAGMLGTFEEYPEEGDERPLFAGAHEIIDSEDLHELLNEGEVARIDVRRFLTARLMDMFMNNFDRHAGQWKWARMSAARESPWIPISRDHDKVLVSYRGFFAGLARLAANQLVPFEAVYPSVSALTFNSLEFDRRLLMGLDRATFDSAARALRGQITNDVIRRALANTPVEQAEANRPLEGMLRARRDLLPELAARFHAHLVAVADVHLSDAAETVTVTREDDGAVTVLARRDGATVFSRRFLPSETHDLRVHLHGGDDVAVVRGRAPSSIETRVIGGNGTNVIVDSSVVAGRSEPTLLYDLGRVSGFDYGKDTLWNRYPWIRYKGDWLPPGPSRGGGMAPVIAVDIERSIGFIGGLGLARTRYGYGTRPYTSRVEFLAEYAPGIGGTRLTLSGDMRRERSPVHLTTTARMSDLEVVNYYGFGNATDELADPFHEAPHRQWLLHPALAIDLRGPRTVVSIGPVVQYTTSDSLAGRFISADRPYGFGEFGQVGARAAAVHDSRGEAKRLRTPESGRIIAATANWYPEAWDVTSSYGRVALTAVNYITLPLPTKPSLLIGGGGAKVFGEAPFHDAAFLGGSGSVHGFELQRYAGDAALYATAELRVPVVKFGFILPFEVGLFGYSDIGRVYLDGESRGGWHRALGAGVRLGVFGQFVNIRLYSRCYGPSLVNPDINARTEC